jgi:hypothetical protein
MSVPKGKNKQAPKAKNQQAAKNKGKNQQAAKVPFYNPVIVPSGPRKALPAVRMVVAAPVAAAPVVIDWKNKHADLTKLIADLTPKITNKENEFGVKDIKLYKDWKKKMEDLLAAETKSIEELLDTEAIEAHKKVTLSFAEAELEEYDLEIQEFWRQIKRAYNIRTRLRRGVDEYFKDSKRTIPELYAGSPQDATEVKLGQSVFSQLINSSDWFTDSHGSVFVEHEGSRSAGLGYHVSGTDARVHIGHKNDKERR